MDSPEGNSSATPTTVETNSQDLARSQSTDKIPKSVSFPLSPEVRSKSSPLLSGNNLRDNPNIFASMKRKPSITYPSDTRMILVDRDLHNLQWAKDFLHYLGYDSKF
jgi:hypothetical protein